MRLMYRRIIAVTISTLMLVALLSFSPDSKAISDGEPVGTAQLVEEILQVDYGFSLFIFSNPELCYNYLAENYDAIRELENRTDAAMEIYSRYEALENVTDENWELFCDKILLGLMLSMPQYQEEVNRNEISSETDAVMAVIEPLSILNHSISNPLESFYLTGVTYTLEGYVRTPQLRRVPYYVADVQFGANGIRIVQEEVENAYPNVIRIEPASTFYNCHSYAWYDTSPSNPYWFNYVDYYAEERHYTTVSKTNAAEWDIVVYLNASGEYTHSAVVTEVTGTGSSVTITCQSKWGQSAVYEHDIDYVAASYYEGLSAPSYIIIRPSITHQYTTDVVSSSSSGHVLECDYCNTTKLFAHSLTGLGICRVCGYSGPSSWDSLPEDPVVTHSTCCDHG